ncbi:MAG: hypothetical protein PHU91_00195 [Candidatus Omnitrophica bacterium]|nr:hypothetical protein [Candidatus Omnitrophota bacterium]MDD5236082.1 hypothetical protein [Candidatus Omnitrophota bacterium]MDD5611050.1 hypothetical protein [Candidatus Omnitrophota bacterium]
MRFIAVLILAATLTGCQTTKSLLGISTKEVESARVNATSKVFNYDLHTCYNKVLGALTGMGSYIYAQKTDMIACYRSWGDTTPVGIFFKEVDANNTQIDISSPSGPVRDEVAEKLFLALEEKPL